MINMNSISRLNGFTLVELLVVVTVLSILSTIASVYFFNNFAEARDTARATDITLISENLELYNIEKSRYPAPDEAIDIEYNWWIAWTQGVFWKDVTRFIENFGQDVPSDPKYNNYYTYSTTNNAQEYQVAGVFEWFNLEEEWLAELAVNWFIADTYAAVNTAYVKWDYNNLMVRSRSWAIDYYIATPSIIASDISVPDAADIITSQKLVYHEFFNLPSSYSGFIDTEWGFWFNVSDPLIFSGSTSELKTDEAITDFSNKLKYIYATTPTESFDVYRSVLDNETPTKVKSFLQKNYQIKFKYFFDCRDILDAWESEWSKKYVIDPDGEGPISSKEVYCDMDTGGGWWTKKWESHITNGFFEWWNNITNAVAYPTSSENQIVYMDNPAYTWSGYALYQTGDNTSYYEVKFDDISQVDVWDEIRMTLWVSWEDDDTWSSLLKINPHAFYMFHNRIYYTDGTFSTNWKVRLLDTRNIWGRDWKLLQVRHEVSKIPQDFSWFIWRDTENTKDLYFTWVDLELYYGGYSDSEDTLYNSRTLAWGGGTIPDAGPPEPEWWDLRLWWKDFTHGNAVGNDIRYHSQISLSRTSNGMQFTWLNSWRSWVKFESAAWNRWDEKTIDWIFTIPTSNNMMTWIGSFNTDEDADRQYRQAELLSYYQRNNGWRFRWMYGNNGNIWSQWSNTTNVSISSCSSWVIKNSITYDGTVGWWAEVIVYCLPSWNELDWDNTDDVLSSYVIGWSLNPDEEILLPFIVPRVSGADYIALKVY